ncbi:MAG: glycosyltransferase family 4 protein [Candidatus Aenigmarchaeota archaeon]|nr:glycosyltransferase family 4 protein [Candidatus Aenigmarchaeota archaeon]
MKICYILAGKDVRSLKGIGRYANELIKEISKSVEVKVINLGKRKRINSIFLLPFKLKNFECDCYHALVPDVATTLVFLKKNTIVTFHDLIPYYALKSKMFKPIAKIFGNFWVKISWENVARKCREIIVPSTQTKNELEEIGIESSKINVIPEGVSEFFKPLNLERKFILFFSNFSYRKRVDLAIEAYKNFVKMIDNPPKLIIAGGYTRSVYQQQIKIEPLIEEIKDKVIVKSQISDEEALRLYNQSYCLLFTSEYEGFGLPILEASRCKTVAIVREEAKIPEEVKENSFVVSTDNLSDALYDIVTNKKKRENLAKKFFKRSLQFNWDKTSKATLKVYEKVVH